MADGEKKDLDLSQAIERGTQRTTLRDLEKKGVQNVKILDEKALEELVSKAVDRVVNTQTAEQREKVLADSRKELDRLMKEHKAARSRAQLLETDKNELIEQLEAMQKELSLQSELEEENLQKKFAEGTASMQAQVEEVRAQQKAERERVERELAQEQSKLREADQARKDAVAQILQLQRDGEVAAQEIRNLRTELVRQRAELVRLQEGKKEGDLQVDALKAAEHARWMLEGQLADAKRELEAAVAEAKAARAEGRKAGAELERLQKQLEGEMARAEAFRAKAAEVGQLKAETERLQALAAQESQRADGFRAELERAVQAAAVEAAVLRERVMEVEHLKAKVIEEHDRGDAFKDVEHSLRTELERTAQAAAVEAAVLRERVIEVEHLKAKVIEEHDRADAFQDVERSLRGEAERLEAELERRRGELGRLERQLAEEHGRLEGLREVERSLRAELARAVAERDRAARALDGSRAEADRLGARAAEVEEQLAAARTEAENLRRGLEDERGLAAGARQAEALLVTQARRLETERDGLSRELNQARQELAAARARLADREKEAEARRETAVVVAAEIDQIEEDRHTEERELERRRAEVEALRRGEERLRGELAEARIDIRSLYEILAREQALAKTAQDESVQLHARSLDIQGQVGGLERTLAELRAAKPAALSDGWRERAAKLREALEQQRKALAAANGQIAKLRTPKAPAPDPRVAKLQEALKAAERRREAAAREAAARLRSLAKPRRLQAQVAKLRTAIERAKKKAAPGLAGGVGLDGRGLLEDFTRRIQLKELFQKHVPVKDRGGRTHPSETLLDVIQATASGPRAARDVKGVRLEIFGAPAGPALDELRTFQSRLAPQAVRQIERVHDGLRHRLVPLPPQGERLVLDLDMPRIDVGKKGRLGSYRPLVCFDGAHGEFWRARLRPAKGEEGDGVLPFLRDCLGKVPRGFARARVLLRLDPRFFSEPVIRFLDRSGVAYVMPAPDSKELRAAARKAALRPLSGGGEVGEFELRLHPIRATKGRFVVVKRKASKPGPAPTFSDGMHAWHILLADRRSGPWRAWTALDGRPAALEAERSLLAGYAESPLLGRGRRARAAAFTNHLLASDLLQWFKRAGLPPAEQGRSHEELRSQILLLAPPGEQRRESTVLLLPRKDGRRRLYRKISARLSRVRSAAPFKLGR